MGNDTFYYYLLLVSGYGTALILWALLSRMDYRLTPNEEVSKLNNAWLQIAGIIVATIATILIGRIYVKGYLLNPIHLGGINISDSLNQILIYAPFPIFILVTRQSFASAWLSPKRRLYRIFIGFVLSSLAMGVFIILSKKRPLPDVILDVYHLKNLHHFIQVFFEDLAIALLLSRFAAALGPRNYKTGLLFVGLLFAGAHIPNNFDSFGVEMSLISLLLDAGLLFVVGLMLFRSRDFLWFFPVHFALDMMQFYSGL